MIPSFNLSGVLPPFIGQTPIDRATCSPYKIQISELISRFSTTPERERLLLGLLDLREALRKLGITEGTQWIDGSFVENVELNRGRPPGDIDIITFANRTVLDQGTWLQIVMQNQNVFNSNQAKIEFGCDHYFLDLLKRPALLVADTSYFFGLFTHQRTSYLWKGMLELPLNSDDLSARALLSGGP